MSTGSLLWTIVRRRNSSVRLAIQLGLLAWLFTLSFGCAWDHPQSINASGESGWQPWQVVDTHTGRVLSSSEWLNELATYDVVYLGEEHHNRYHIEAALKVLNWLVAHDLQPTIGIEMFGWDGQPALDEYVLKDRLGRNQFLEQVKWSQNWGGAFEDYEPLVAFARDRHLSILAMNPPRPFIRRVVKAGLDQVRHEQEWTHWGLDQEEIVDDPAYRARIIDQLQQCHGGGTEDQFRTMYEASMVRDEGMAKTLTAGLDALHRQTSSSRGVIVSYTGAGHIQYGLPVPMRVARRVSGQVKQTTIYMTSFDKSRIEDIRELVREKIADYIWLTPMSQKGPPKRCR
ncbi:MAG: ChaN family lipoprotein [Nitrospira sp.]|nr:ChaN family lipoprotein [Nitrospira sp.]